MEFINLTFDINRKLFSLPVMLLKRIKNMMNTSHQITERCFSIMYLDTGSNLTSITDLEAMKLKLDMNGLKFQKVGGIGGFVNTLKTHEVKVYVQSSSNTIFVKLDRIAVHPSEIRGKISKKGIYKAKGVESAEMINLFGLDTLEKLNGKLEINMRDKSGNITI